MKYIWYPIKYIFVTPPDTYEKAHIKACVKFFDGVDNGATNNSKRKLFFFDDSSGIFPKFNKYIFKDMAGEFQEFYGAQPVPKWLKLSDQSGPMSLNDVVSDFIKTNQERIKNFFKKKEEISHFIFFDEFLNSTFSYLISLLFYENRTLINLYGDRKFKDVLEGHPDFLELMKSLEPEVQKINAILSKLFDEYLKIQEQNFCKMLKEVEEEVKTTIIKSKLNQKISFVQPSGEYDHKVLELLNSVLRREAIDESLKVDGFLNLLSWEQAHEIRLI